MAMGRPLLVTTISRSSTNSRQISANIPAELLYDLARIAEGEPPDDAAGFARRMTGMMTKALGGGQ
jgi:HSP90 family molecular chaperone